MNDENSTIFPNTRYHRADFSVRVCWWMEMQFLVVKGTIFLAKKHSCECATWCLLHFLIFHLTLPSLIRAPSYAEGLIWKYFSFDVGHQVDTYNNGLQFKILFINNFFGFNHKDVCENFHVNKILYGNHCCNKLKPQNKIFIRSFGRKRFSKCRLRNLFKMGLRIKFMAFFNFFDALKFLF
jgi:hypothetical protein